MNQIDVIYSSLNNGQKTKFNYAFSYDAFSILFAEIFEAEEYKKGIVKESMIVIDCGANIGLATTYFQPHAKMIYAIEPAKESYEALVENTKNYPNVKTFNIGLGQITWKQTLYGYDGSIPDTTCIKSNPTSKETIDVMAIDEFMKKNNIEHVDLLKIDCEGSEYGIFISEGFKKIAPKIDYIIGEAHEAFPFRPSHVPVILKEHGFETEKLDIDNIYYTVTTTNQLTKEKKEYKANEQTMFFSKRIK